MTKSSKKILGLIAFGSIVFIGYQNTTPTVSCNNEICEDIVRAIYQARKMDDGLTNAQIIEHAANRLGYGLSPVSNILPSQADDNQKIIILARQISNQLRSPDYLPEDLDILRQGLTVQTENGYRTNILSQSSARLQAIRGQAVEDGNRRDASSIGRKIADSYADLSVLRAIFGSQVKRRGGINDLQVNLNSVLHEFWYNHFNISIDKSRFQVGGNDGYEYQLHQNMYRSFEELLVGVIKSPAMLRYLDNHMNRIVAVETPTGLKRIASNQNLGRELLELHTIGQPPRTEERRWSPYDQTDVEESSKILAGHIIKDGKYFFSPLRAAKNRYCNSRGCADETPEVMNVQYPEQGEQKLRSLLRNLAQHPATKNNICRKLVRRFYRIVEDSPLERCLAAYGNSGNLRAMYAAILTAPLFWSKSNYRNTFKNPFELVVSQIRASGVSIEDLEENPNLARSIANKALSSIRKIGLNVRRYDEPTGYKQNGRAWFSSGYLAQAVTLSFSSQYMLETLGAELVLDPVLENSISGIASRDPASNDFALVQKIYRDVTGFRTPNLSVHQKQGIVEVLADDDKIHKFYRKSGGMVRPYAKTSADLITSQFAFLLK